jgi:predicted RNase H-like HicB family nuclease
VRWGDMKNKYTYYFAIIIEKGEDGYMSYAPGVGGVYEEGATKKEAIENAYKAACAILETRIQRNDPLTENNKYLRVITSVPNYKEINEFSNIIPDGYIYTSFCTP